MSGMTEGERSDAFKKYLESTAKPQPCESCNYASRNWRGRLRSPCQKGHEDSGSGKTFCEDHPDSQYHPK